MLKACILLVGLFFVASAWAWPALAYEASTAARQAGLSVTTDQPQASAEALLKLPSVYILPGSPLYWAKHLFETIRLIFAGSDQARASLLVQFGQERLAEGYQAFKEGKLDESVSSFSRYSENQDQLNAILSSLHTQKLPLGSLVEELQHQWDTQHLLEDRVSKSKTPGSRRVSKLLHARAVEDLVYRLEPERAVLGARDRRPQATASAEPTSTEASTSTQLQRQESQP